MEREGDGDFTAQFTFDSGETLTLKQHYATLGAPRRDAVSARRCVWRAPLMTSFWHHLTV
jgi:hypothetical protein